MLADCFIAINIRCDSIKFKALLDKAKISYYEFQTKTVSFYYDDLTYCLFKFKGTRKDIIDQLKLHHEIMEQIIEFSFYNEIS